MGNSEVQVFDCFPFFNELDLLEIRLNELDSVVDKFVLVEAAYTHQNGPKPYYFEENKARFARFLHKIIHVKVEDVPESYYSAQDKSWILENHQRNCIARGLAEANDNDKIMISDLDEIPKSEKVLVAKDIPGVVSFGLAHFAYFLNTQVHTKRSSIHDFKLDLLSLFSKPYRTKRTASRFWVGTIMVKKSLIQSIQYFRNNRSNPEVVDLILPQAGWHFSYLGGIQKIIEKLNAINVEFDYNPYKDMALIEDRLSKGIDIFDPEKGLVTKPLDASFPSFITQNKENYQLWIKS